MRRLCLFVLATLLAVPAPATAQSGTTVTLCLSGVEGDLSPGSLAEAIADGTVGIEAIGPCPAEPRATGGILPAPTAPVSDACALVPDIEAIVRRRLMLFGEGLNIPTGSDVVCIWTFNDHPAESVTLTVGRPELWDDQASSLGILGGQVEDLERGWLWSSDSGFGETLLARSPTMTAVVSLSLEGEARSQDIGIAIAEVALGLVAR